MPKVIDLSGQRFERWLVIERVPNLPRRVTAWLCRCDCGTERVVSGQNLRSGLTRSCGCFQRDRMRQLFDKEEVGYHTAHAKVARRRGPASSYACVDCARPAQDWSLRRGAPGLRSGLRRGGIAATWSIYVDDYEPRCKSCHCRYDGIGSWLPPGGGRPVIPKPRVSDEIIVDARTAGD